LRLQLTVPFDLDVTLCCGQVFRWERRGGWWFGIVGDRPVKVRQAGGVLDFEGVDERVLTCYFSLDHDLDRIAGEVGRDEHVRAALREFWGLRLVRQEPWECLASFICATYKSVAAIRQMLVKLAARSGEHVTFEGEEFHVFPSAARLAEASLGELEACGLGYRAKYLLETSRMVAAGGFDVQALREMPYVEAKRVLLGFPGVGRKVADCVLLFSLGKLEAFPVDVWMKRVLLRHYAGCFDTGFVKKLEKGGLSDGDYERLNDFGRAYFGCFAGYAQEYLYHYERCRVHDRKLEKPKRAIA
jgi:N-glycosylase/DNA lyase